MWKDLKEIQGVKLSLPLRQNMRDHYAKYREYCDEMQEMTGLALVKLEEDDFKNFYETMTKFGAPEQVGDFRESVVCGIRDVIKECSADALVFEELKACWTSGKIIVKQHKDKKVDMGYWRSEVKNGNWNLFWKETPWANLEGYQFKIGLIETLGNESVEEKKGAAAAAKKPAEAKGSSSSSSGEDWTTIKEVQGVKLTLQQRQNFRDNFESYKENCQKIKDLMGKDKAFVEEADFSKLAKSLAKSDAGNQLGQFRSDVARVVFEVLESVCSDDMVKDAISEGWTTGKILVQEGKKGEEIYYWRSQIKDGNYVLTYAENSGPWCNFECSMFKNGLVEGL